MGLPVEQAVKLVGLIMLEMMKAKWGDMVCPGGELEDLYEPALAEFQHFLMLEGQSVNNVPAGLRQMVLDDINRYLEAKGMLL